MPVGAVGVYVYFVTALLFGGLYKIEDSSSIHNAGRDEAHFVASAIKRCELDINWPRSAVASSLHRTRNDLISVVR